jgi:serine/threonine-protein kinase
MSPEQGRAESIGAATDIYATGVVLFELLTGTKPYNADNPIDTIHLHQFAPLPSIRERLPEADFSAELDEAIQTALAKDPSQRYASAQLFAEALDFVPEAAPTRTSTRLRALTAPPGRGRAESSQLGSDGVSPAVLATALLAPTAAESPGTAAPASKGGTVSLSNSDIQVVSSAEIVIASPAQTVAPLTPPADAETDTEEPRETSVEAISSPVPASGAPAKPRTRGSTRWLVLASMFLTVAGLVTWYATRDEVLQPVDTPSPQPTDEFTGTQPSTELSPARPGHDERAARGAQTTARKPTLPAQEQHAGTTRSAAESASGQNTAQNTAEPGDGQAAAATATTRDPAPVEAQPPPKPPEPAAAPVDSIADVERLIQQGRREDAIQGILRLRRTTFPRSGYLAYLLGNLYFDKMYWDDGLDAYLDAVKFTPQYRSNANVNENAIRALSHDQARHKAATLFTDYIRRSGLKYLRKAATSDKNPKVRQRAKALMTRISRGRR